MIYQPIPEKRCSKCGKSFPATPTYFHRATRERSGLKAMCKACIAAHDGRSSFQFKHPTREGYKVCAKCQSELPATLEHFHSNKGKPDGLNSICKGCARQRERGWRTQNASLEKERDRLRRVTYADKRLVYNLRRNARQKDLPDTFNESDWKRALKYFCYRCAYCGAIIATRLTADHFIPLNTPNCPGTVPANIIPACLSCNCSKGDTEATEWLIVRYGEERARQILARIQAYFASLEDKN